MLITPLDDHNAKLLDAVAPKDWCNPKPSACYNLVVLGGGTAGLVSATMAAYLGAKVALVERNLLGGDCLVTGCVPSKALLRSARFVADSKRGEQYIGSQSEGVTPDFPSVMDRLRRIRAQISEHDSVGRLVTLGVDVFYGDAAFTSKRTVSVGGRSLAFKKAIIACGARATLPEIPGLYDAGFYTNETIFNCTELPQRLVVIGGGPLGSELAQAFCRLGSQITIVQEGQHFLPKEDSDARTILQRNFENEGIRLLLATKVLSVSKDKDERIMQLEGPTGPSELRVDAILVAVGRSPNIEGLRLEEAGVAYSAHHGVTVDDCLRTSNRSIFAAGDVALSAKFTHAAEASAKIAVSNALLFGRQKFSRLPLPWCTYTDPEIAHVGLHAHEAEAKGISTTSVTLPMADNDRANTDGETEGFLKITLKKGSDTILGATLVGSHAGDIISLISLAMHAKLGLTALGKCMYPYPTVAEIVKNASAQYQISRLTPAIQKASRIFFTLMR